MLNSTTCLAGVFIYQRLYYSSGFTLTDYWTNYCGTKGPSTASYTYVVHRNISFTIVIAFVNVMLWIPFANHLCWNIFHNLRCNYYGCRAWRRQTAFNCRAERLSSLGALFTFTLTAPPGVTAAQVTLQHSGGIPKLMILQAHHSLTQGIRVIGMGNG